MVTIMNMVTSPCNASNPIQPYKLIFKNVKWFWGLNKESSSVGFEQNNLRINVPVLYQLSYLALYCWCPYFVNIFVREFIFSLKFVWPCCVDYSGNNELMLFQSPLPYNEIWLFFMTNCWTFINSMHFKEHCMVCGSEKVLIRGYSVVYEPKASITCSHEGDLKNYPRGLTPTFTT